MEPINTRDPVASARAYLGLGWPLMLGHRHRPRQGCTCDSVDCPAPGAHPCTEERTRVTHENAFDVLENAPGASLIAATRLFDVVIVPRYAAMAVLIQVDRVSPVPCVVNKKTAAMLVLPATGRYAAGDEQIEVRTGPDGWLALPPSHGALWDTPPWIDPTDVPRPLLHGADIGRLLTRVFNHGLPQSNDRAGVLQ